jgi:hypothetical protein
MTAHTCSKYEVEYTGLSDWECFQNFVQWITENDLEAEVYLCYNEDIQVSDWFEFNKKRLAAFKNHEKYDKKWDKLIEYMLTDSDPNKSFVRVELF